MDRTSRLGEAEGEKFVPQHRVTSLLIQSGTFRADTVLAVTECPRWRPKGEAAGSRTCTSHTSAGNAGNVHGVCVCMCVVCVVCALRMVCVWCVGVGVGGGGGVWGGGGGGGGGVGSYVSAGLPVHVCRPCDGRNRACVAHVLWRRREAHGCL